MNPKVRSSPFSPPPADELVLSADDVFSTRRRRLFFLSIHLAALAGLYCCVTGQVKLYTVLFGEFNDNNVHPLQRAIVPWSRRSIRRGRCKRYCLLYHVERQNPSRTGRGRNMYARAFHTPRIPLHHRRGRIINLFYYVFCTL